MPRFAAAALDAQVLSGSLVVEVRDQTGAAVRGADVTVVRLGVRLGF